MLESKTVPTIQYRDFSLKVHERAADADRVIKAQVELTYRCNLHCVHCYTDPYNDREYFPRELTLEELTRLFDEMADLGILWLNLTGGEIFTRPDFFDIYDDAYRRGFLLQLYTNGTILTEAIVERLRGSPPFSIDISCHSVNEEAFDRFTQVSGSFRKFAKGMELLRESGLPFSFKTKAMNWNKEEMPEIKRFVESFGQPFGFTTSLSPRLNGDLSSLAHRLDPVEIPPLEETLMGHAQEDDWCPEEGSLGDLPMPTERLFRCGCGTNTIHISAWGELGTCTMQYERRASLRAYSLKEAIEKVFTELRSLQYTTDSPCKSCRIFTFCGKQPTDARREAGDAEMPIPWNCDLALGRAEQALRRPLIHPLRVRRQARGAHHA